jgi:hypothetical protein
MFPFLDNAGFAYGASKTVVVSTDCAYSLPVEARLTVLDGCGEFADAHVHRQNRSVLAFQACLLLNGYVHEPFVVFSAKEFAFPQFELQ